MAWCCTWETLCTGGVIEGDRQIYCGCGQAAKMAACQGPIRSWDETQCHCQLSVSECRRDGGSRGGSTFKCGVRKKSALGRRRRAAMSWRGREGGARRRPVLRDVYVRYVRQGWKCKVRRLARTYTVRGVVKKIIRKSLFQKRGRENTRWSATSP